MILDLLQQQGLAGRVDGEYLQGGIGELPAAGLVRVMVEEQDYAAAKAIIDKWDAVQPLHVPVPAPRKAGSRFGALLLGVVAGAAISYAYHRGPVMTEGIDYTGNGVLDERWTFAPGGRTVKYDIDRNRDGKVDYITRFSRDGTIDFVDADDNFDGVFESRTHYRQGNPELTETDTDKDGFRDFKTNFEHGVIVSFEYIYPATGRPQKIEYLKPGKNTHAELDTDKDGKMDKRIRYDEIGEILAVEDIR